ncbi:anti-sigma factor family protein [Bordetella petrii]|uniref:Transmembrane regulator n=1 Tax=Bordetella petrii (strain ATCC BAA-461 / DSM 12804 / CCUG 43448 / CIP 107267 / Se-1111R) TaxID=340100 RepID=A9I0C7_BORPD|nr:anti-sigma factor [Bordetella petrii]CAP44038.1 transmembrane regulator [Bordetella petrii]
MNDQTPHLAPGCGAPIAEADLHAYVDRQLSDERAAEIAAFLQQHPEARERVQAWREQNRLLREWLAPVASEPLPLRLPLAPPVAQRRWPALAAALALAACSATAAWLVRGELDRRQASAARVAAATAGEAAFAHRAAIAHAVYAADARRPVEIGADQEQALVTWLTKRLGAPVRAPALAQAGYALVGGRLLPGGQGPVAQFMYASPEGRRLTLYVTREAAGGKTAFQFAQEGPVRVFYWVDGSFGYALSGEVERGELMRISTEVYRQLGAAPAG